jgi:two-component system nitrogen regulation response regulator NtrX
MRIQKPGDADHRSSILIVDDDENILELLAEGFKLHGMKVFKAQSGDEAWTLFNRESVDAVLTDVWMPGMDGLELSSRIHQHSPQTNIALMTGGDTTVAKKLVEEGIVNHFFEKPFALSFVCKSIVTEVQMD